MSDRPVTGELFTYGACVHFAAVRTASTATAPERVENADLPHPFGTDYCSFREWSEPLDDDHDGDPQLVEAYVQIPLITAEQVRTGKPGRAALFDFVEPMFETLALALPRGWRVGDFAVVTLDSDHGVDVEWIGRWGA